MKVLLDLNVLPDVIQNRQPNAADFSASPAKAISPADFLKILSARRKV
jgi:hypothetical protein